MKNILDIVKSYNYDFIRIKSKYGGTTLRQNKIIDEQLDILLKDYSSVELLTKDSYIIITEDDIEVLTRSI